MSPPVNLKSPYKWMIPAAKVAQCITELQALLKSIDQTGGKKPFMQCCTHWRVNLRYGVHLKLFLLSPDKGILTSYDGMTKEEWDAATQKLHDFLQSYFPGCKPYKESHRKGGKSQFTFETHIMYEELKDLVKQPKKKNK
jgi:hypothetical protein